MHHFCFDIMSVVMAAHRICADSWVCIAPTRGRRVQEVPCARCGLLPKPATHCRDWDGEHDHALSTLIDLANILTGPLLRLLRVPERVVDIGQGGLGALQVTKCVHHFGS